ncbi:hypothetical protein [Streptomyces sp.]|nr:hypothetical protein [Streptomyces sp.]HET6359739.1 hypothetical protein [Streptomyces sp.]
MCFVDHVILAGGGTTGNQLFAQGEQLGAGVGLGAVALFQEV